MNAIVPRTSSAVPMRPVLVPQTFDQLVTFAELAANSDLVPKDYKGKAANVMIAVQMGSELGLSPMQSIQSIAIINGRPGVWGDGLIGICRGSSLCQDIQESIEGEGDARTAICVAIRRGSSPVTGKFSVADAKKAGLWGKDIWGKYPDRMLQNRARGFCLRDAFPDLLRGIKTVEELRDYPEEPREVHAIREAQPVQSSPARLPAPAPRPRDAVDNDAIPSFDAPPPDKLAEGTDRLVAKIETSADAAAVFALSDDPKIQAWRRDKLVDARPELEQRIVDALRVASARFMAVGNEPALDDMDDAGEAA